MRGSPRGLAWTRQQDNAWQSKRQKNASWVSVFFVFLKSLSVKPI